MHWFVVIASPESMAWQSAQGTSLIDADLNCESGAASFGKPLLIDPFHASDVGLFAALQPPVDGPVESAVPRWAVYDCAEVPGAVVALLSKPVEGLHSAPLDPRALLLATPHAELGTWHFCAMSVFGPDDGRADARLRLLHAAMQTLDARHATLMVPWSAPWLDSLTSVALVELLSPRTALHERQTEATLMLHAQPAGAPAAEVRTDLSVPMDVSALDAVLDRMQDVLDDGARLILDRPPPDLAEVRLVVREVPP